MPTVLQALYTQCFLGEMGETVSEVKPFASVMAVKAAEEVELSTEAGLSTRLTAYLPIRPRTGGPEGGVGLMLFQSVPVKSAQM